MIDDTDFPKTGRRMENIGRVHSHLEHRSILGFKALFLGITDGISQVLLDFAILGEKGRKGNYGMSGKELSKRFCTERDEDVAVRTRLDEYSMSKIDLAIEMIRRAIRNKICFRYVLADSWFTCAKIVRFIRSRHVKCDYIGMIKVGKEGPSAAAIAKVFSIDDEEVLDALVNESDELAHICELYQYKMAS